MSQIRLQAHKVPAELKAQVQSEAEQHRRSESEMVLQACEAYYGIPATQRQALADRARRHGRSLAAELSALLNADAPQAAPDCSACPAKQPVLMPVAAPLATAPQAAKAPVKASWLKQVLSWFDANSNSLAGCLVG